MSSDDQASLAALRPLLALAGVEVDAEEERRLAAAYRHYRLGIDLLYQMDIPPETRPYLVADVDSCCVSLRAEPWDRS